MGVAYLIWRTCILQQVHARARKCVLATPTCKKAAQMEAMEESDDQDSQLQIDLGSGPRPEQKSSTTSGAADKHSAMTWLQAAEQVLRDEGPEMHIRDLTRTILELGIVGRHVDKRFPSPFVC